MTDHAFDSDLEDVEREGSGIGDLDLDDVDQELEPLSGINPNELAEAVDGVLRNDPAHGKVKQGHRPAL